MPFGKNFWCLYMRSEDLLGSTLSEHLFIFLFPLIILVGMEFKWQLQLKLKALSDWISWSHSLGVSQEEIPLVHNTAAWLD